MTSSLTSSLGPAALPPSFSLFFGSVEAASECSVSGEALRAARLSLLAAHTSRTSANAVARSVRPTPMYWLSLLSNLYPPQVRRTGALVKEFFNFNRTLIFLYTTIYLPCGGIVCARESRPYGKLNN
nr:unnamed protein product [Callosobruchus analis]